MSLMSSSSPDPVPWFPSFLSRYSTLLFDCDGVLWHESTVVSGAVDTVSTLQSSGHRVLFVTNNSGKSRAQYREKLTEMGFTTHKDTDVLSTSYATAHYLSHCAAFDVETRRVFIVGDRGIGEELSLQGIHSVDARNLIGEEVWSRDKLSSIQLLQDIGAVVVGIDDKLTYSKISYAASLLINNPDCLFIATNRDATLPTTGHSLPGAGSCVAAVSCASQRDPINMGKPEPLMFELALGKDWKNSRKECLMIGDRLDTDIAFGCNAGIDTLLVETGINKREDVYKAGNTIFPTYIIKDVNAMIAEQ